MKQLTVPQIILLLQISENDTIAMKAASVKYNAINEDLKVLQNTGLVTYRMNTTFYDPTIRGKQVVHQIKKSFIY